MWPGQINESAWLRKAWMFQSLAFLWSNWNVRHNQGAFDDSIYGDNSRPTLPDIRLEVRSLMLWLTLYMLSAHLSQLSLQEIGPWTISPFELEAAKTSALILHLPTPFLSAVGTAWK